MFYRIKNYEGFVLFSLELTVYVCVNTERETDGQADRER